jgi:carboxyl-terminal processing protease
MEKKRYILIPTIVVFLAVVFGAGFLIGKTSQPSVEQIHSLENKELGQPAVDFSLFWDTWRVIETKYVDRTNLDYQKMVYGAIGGLLNSLDDPYSVFMEPQDSKRFLDDINGSFGGIGAEVGIRKGILTVIAPLEGNPAQKAGLKPGDKILKVDDTLTMDLNLDEAVNMIRGEIGTEVTLLISREEWDEAKEITIERGNIKIPIFNWEIKEGNIAYVEFFHFTENSDSEFRGIAKQISNTNGLILDLRGNPGGYLESAVNIASWFVSKNEPVVIENFGNGEEDNIYRSKGYGRLEDMKTVILIDEGSASASEILAGALRDHKGIQIVGQKSFGKGSVQQLEKLKGGSSVKLTVAKWLTPNGVCIEEEGITPDFEVEITEEDVDEMRDPQLEKALELFRENVE